MDVNALVSVFLNINELRLIPLQVQTARPKKRKKKCHLKVTAVKRMCSSQDNNNKKCLTQRSAVFGP